MKARVVVVSVERDGLVKWTRSEMMVVLQDIGEFVTYYNSYCY